MKKSFCFKHKFLKFWFSVIFFVFFICQTNLQSVEAISLENNQNGQVLEELRLTVPSKFKDVWLDAEKEIALSSGIAEEAAELIAGKAALGNMAYFPMALIVLFGFLFLMRNKLEKNRIPQS